MTEQSCTLFSPLTIGSLTLKGRLVKSATSETRATEKGEANELTLAFYRPLSMGNTPLIITGNIYVSEEGKSTAFQLGADHDNKIAGLTRLTSCVHQSDSKIFAQLSHCGRQVIPESVGAMDVVSASSVKDQITGTRPRELRVEEIHNIIEDFATAAKRCKQAGFDGVQIHAGHGYLISQFLTPYTNKRVDQYGGSAQNRMRFLKDVYTAIRNAVGNDFPVIIKINGSDYLPLRPGLNTEQLVEIAKQMELEGVDAVEVSVGHYESGFPFVRGTFLRCLRGMVSGSVQFMPPFRRLLFTIFWPLIGLVSNLIWRPRPGFNLRYARHFKAILNIPVICVGGFLEEDDMQQALSDRLCDAISAGRPFIADPLLYHHLQNKRTGPKCVFCNACIGRVGSEPLDCYHPRVRKEKDTMLSHMDDGTNV